MKTLWRSLIQPYFDYACIVWAPVGIKTDIEAQEGPLRAFTRYIKGCHNLNYWERLDYAQLSSISTNAI